MHDGTVQLQVTSDTADVATVREQVTESARAAGFTEIEITGIALAVCEAMCNVIQHGYQGRAGEPIELTIESIDAAQDGPINCPPAGGLQFTLRDRARQVDPASIVGRELDKVRPGGLGTHIIRSVMDQVEYSARESGGMQLRMLKLVKPTTAASDPAIHSVQEGKHDGR